MGFEIGRFQGKFFDKMSAFRGELQHRSTKSESRSF